MSAPKLLITPNYGPDGILRGIMVEVRYNRSGTMNEEHYYDVPGHITAEELAKGMDCWELDLAPAQDKEQA